jgi:putative ABC transport system ATP-binding protein
MTRLIQDRKDDKGKSNGSYRFGNENLIELRRVTKAYKSASSSFIALSGVNLSVDNGEFVAVIGKSGSGKSTLLNMLTGIDRPTTGEVMVGDVAVHKLSESKMAVWRGLNIGIVFQFFQLLPTLTVIENVILPMDFCHKFSLRERQKRANYLLELVDLVDQAKKLPSALSGGQQQRVAIARALANDPPILVADEPTGNLDSKTALSIFTLFETLASQGKTILMVTHDKDLSRKVKRTVFIADGEIIGDYSGQPGREPEGYSLDDESKRNIEEEITNLRTRIAFILDDQETAPQHIREEFLQSIDNHLDEKIVYKAILTEVSERATHAENAGRYDEARVLWKILLDATEPFVKERSEFE